MTITSVRLPYGEGDADMSNGSGDESARVLRSFLNGLVLDRARTYYLSTAVSTGRWFYEELLRRGVRGSIDEVPRDLMALVKPTAIAHNRAITEAAFTRLQGRAPHANFINPAALLADWTQSEFLSFWVEVLDRYVGTIVMTPDWEYSTGAAFECLTSIRNGIPVETIDGDPIDRDDAREAVLSAVSDLHGRGLVVPELLRVVDGFSEPH